MYISNSALSGSRRNRLVMGGILTPLLALLGVVFTVVAVNSADSPLSLAAFAAVAVSAFAVAWWGARYWYAALKGTREPSWWPWALPPVTLVTILVVSGVRALRAGDDGGVGLLVMAGFLLLPAVIGGVAGLIGGRAHRNRTRRAPAPAPHSPAPQRPARAWGSIDRDAS
ncbi:hypothetical protein ABZY90_15820 [Streptomyces sp. NPDC006422]|uniref:hypothetical protein n=1 Tax=unclassified Streptomyces TaxID=2593676 RepID=UPI0033B50F2F